ncbi:unnamed protein product, partial [Musa textilis]
SISDLVSGSPLVMASAGKALSQSFKRFFKMPWEITGPCSSPEYRSSLPEATEYRRFCPATAPAKVCVPTTEPETVFDISTTRAIAAAIGPPFAGLSSGRPMSSGSWPPKPSALMISPRSTSPSRWRRTKMPGAAGTRSEAGCRAVVFPSSRFVQEVPSHHQFCLCRKNFLLPR